MKIGVIADTHIPDRAGDIPQQIMENFKNADMIIHAGDLVNLSVLDKLQALCKDIRAVYGNMDSDDVRKKLPQKQLIKVGNYNIGVMHGHGNPNKLMDFMAEQFKNHNVDLLIFGHSHYALNEKKGNILYFNPGSPTDKIFAPYNSYGLIEINDKIEAKIIKL